MQATARHVTDSDLERVRVFLEGRVDTSLFLLSTLAALGPRAAEHPNSGNFWLLEDAAQVLAVFCLTRRGVLLVQAAGRADVAADILEACRTEAIDVRGVVGDWVTAEALWDELRRDVGFTPTHILKDVVYRLELETVGEAPPVAPDAPVPTGSTPAAQVKIRKLAEADFNQWEPLNRAYFAELKLPMTATMEERRADFRSRTHSGMWWGAFGDDGLIAVAALNATYGVLGQVGGVYTRPQSRGHGVARALMSFLIADSQRRLGFETLILFTAEDNGAARHLYESLGFRNIGVFGLLFGERRGGARNSQRQRRPEKS